MINIWRYAACKIALISIVFTNKILCVWKIAIKYSICNHYWHLRQLTGHFESGWVNLCLTTVTSQGQSTSDSVNFLQIITPWNIRNPFKTVPFSHLGWQLSCLLTSSSCLHQNLAFWLVTMARKNSVKSICLCIPAWKIKRKIQITPEITVTNNIKLNKNRSHNLNMDKK